MKADITFIDRSKKKGEVIPTYRVKVTGSHCPNCGSGKIHTQKNCDRDFTDVDKDGKFRLIECNFVRHRCTNCGNIWASFNPDYLYRYTPECQQYLVDSFYNGDKTTADLSRESGLSQQTIRGILRNYMKAMGKKKQYDLPGTIAVTPVFRGKKTFYIISDPVNMLILDVLSETGLVGLDLHRVRDVYLTDTRISKKILKLLTGSKQVWLMPGAVYESGIRALLEDAGENGQDIRELEALMRDTEKAQKEYLMENISATPYVAGLKDLKSRKGDWFETKNIEKSGLKNYTSFVQSLPQVSELSELENDDLLEAFNRSMKDFVLESEFLPKKFRSADQFVTKLLYIGDLDEGVRTPNGEILFNSGKRLEVRSQTV